MNPNPRVSVVIPAYNAGGTIEVAVRSALGQSVADIEVIVIDDGSLDDTAEAVLGIGDPRVELCQSSNTGVCAARNLGLERARGEWIAFLDADDVWMEHKLERQLEAMDAVPDCMACQTGAYVVDDELKPIRLRRCKPMADPLLTFLRFQNLPAAMSSWVVRRDLLARIGGFDPDLVRHEDWDLSLRLAQHANPICIDEPLTLYRQHAGNRSLDVDLHVESGLRILGDVFSNPDLRTDIRRHRREVYARYYTMLCGAMFRTHRYRSCAYWGLRAVTTNPRVLVYIIDTPFRRMRRRPAVRDLGAAQL